jgi:hypothetical protein
MMEKAIALVVSLSQGREAAVKYVHVGGLAVLLSLMDTHASNLEILQAAQVSASVCAAEQRLCISCFVCICVREVAGRSQRCALVLRVQGSLTNLAAIEEVQEAFVNIDGVHTVLKRLGAHIDSQPFVQVGVWGVSTKCTPALPPCAPARACALCN